MDELPREAKNMLALAKSAQPRPEPGARERVRSRVDAAVAAAALTESGSADEALSKLGTSKGLLTNTKVMLASAALFVAAGGVLLATRAPVAPRTERAEVGEVEVLAVPQARKAEEEVGTSPSPSTSMSTSTSTKHVSATPTLHEPSLADEMALLSQASDALNQRDTSRARLLLSEHKKRFRHPQLREERDGLSLLTHCLERPDAVRSEARSFVQRNPAMMLAARIKQACGLPEHDGT